jgi:thiosulfate dehydrogenase
MTKMKQTGLRKMTIRKASLNAVTVMGLTVVACTPSGSASSDTETTVQAPELLIPSTATLERVGELLYDPMADSIHPDPRMASMIRLGFQISQDPQTYASEFVGNDLTCGNCHLNAGQRDRALPLLGVAATFPQYRRRDDRLVSLEDRIAGCFKRSMNGTAPPYDHPVMLALDAYLNWLSEGFAMGERPAWLGQNEIAVEDRIPIEELDVNGGEELYNLHCAPCHGLDGQGIDLILAKPGPLWGPLSWNDGAGAARIWKLAGYIKHAMPLTAPGTLTDEEAQLISAYVNSHERPEYPDKESDFPDGTRPADAVYDTLVFSTHPLMRADGRRP